LVIADLARSVVNAEASAALRVIHGQSEAGKDLSKLLADLIGFFRHLLIDQVDSASVQQELSELGRTIVRELSRVVKPGELLRLIEILSEAEPTMKWTSNKKLYLEIAVIRAIQSLREVGIDRVLDALENLSGQGSTGSGTTPVRHGLDDVARKVPPPSHPGKATVGRSTEERLETSSPNKTADDDLSAVIGTKEEDELVTVPAKVLGVQEPISSSNDTADLGDIGGENLPALWSKVVEEVRRRRPLILSWIEIATPLGQSGTEVLIGFPRADQVAMESLLRSNNRKFVEDLLSEFAAGQRTIRAELRDDLVRREPVAESERKTNLLGGFKNDPLIQKALEIFRAEIEAES
jgi:DNA polymerase-3 subunit gamma/tau